MKYKDIYDCKDCSTSLCMDYYFYCSMKKYFQDWFFSWVFFSLFLSCSNHVLNQSLCECCITFKMACPQKEHSSFSVLFHTYCHTFLLFKPRCTLLKIYKLLLSSFFTSLFSIKLPSLDEHTDKIRGKYK